METYREIILKEAYEYKGHMFWENYILSHLVRTVAEDLKSYEPEDIIEMYSIVYGEETTNLFEYMTDNREALNEAAKIKGIFLFEEVGAKNIKEYLNEIDMSTLSGRHAIRAALERGRRALGKGSALTGTGAATSALKIGASKGAPGFLSGLWAKLKELGAGIFGKITPFLQKGFAWAKELVTKGVAWISNNPIARIAVPAVLIAGSVLAAKKLINKIRNKRKMKKMSPEEEKELEDVAEKNKDKITKMKAA